MLVIWQQLIHLPHTLKSLQTCEKIFSNLFCRIFATLKSMRIFVEIVFDLKWYTLKMTCRFVVFFLLSKKHIFLWNKVTKNVCLKTRKIVHKVLRIHPNFEYCTKQKITEPQTFKENGMYTIKCLKWSLILKTKY